MTTTRVGLKQGIKINLLQPEIVLAIIAIRDVYEFYNEPELIITAGNDGKHMVGSLHYKGYAIDLRLPKEGKNWGAIVAMIKAFLGENFDVILEKTHIHVEYDPPQ